MQSISSQLQTIIKTIKYILCAPRHLPSKHLLDLIFRAQLHRTLPLQIFHVHICPGSQQFFHLWRIVFAARHQQQQIHGLQISCTLRAVASSIQHPTVFLYFVQNKQNLSSNQHSFNVHSSIFSSRSYVPSAASIPM